MKENMIRSCKGPGEEKQTVPIEAESMRICMEIRLRMNGQNVICLQKKNWKYGVRSTRINRKWQIYKIGGSKHFSF